MLEHLTDIGILAVIVVQFSLIWHRLGRLEGKISAAGRHCDSDEKEEEEPMP